MRACTGTPLVQYIERISSIVPKTSIVKPHPPRVGTALAALRQSRGLSLEELSRQAGVSKSMLSQIERHQATERSPRGVAPFLVVRPTWALAWR